MATSPLRRITAGIPMPAGLAGPGDLGVLWRARIIGHSGPLPVLRSLHLLRRWGATIATGYLVAAARHPDGLAVIDDGTELTYSDLVDRGRRLATVLVEHGARPGVPIALLAPNRHEVVETLLAAALAGVDTVLLNTGMGPGPVAGVLADQGATVLLADDDLEGACVTTPPGVTRIVLDDLGAAIDAATPIALDPPSRPGRITVMTSGTTGAPRGARRPTPAGIGPLAAMLSRIPLQAEEPTFIAAPIFHTWGLANLQIATSLRSTVVLRRRFEPEDALATLAQHRCTAMAAVPVMIQRMLEVPRAVRDALDLSALRVVASSGSALPPDLAIGFQDAFGDVLHNLYGSTEVSWASIATPAELRAEPTTAGRPPRGTMLRVLRDDGTDADPGETGRIVVANELLFDGYTSGSDVERLAGGIATGDLGHMDDDGLLFVEGRTDDMIVSGGENVFAGEVEAAIRTLGSVADVAAVAVDDPEFGQRLAAFVVPAEGSEVTADAVRSVVRDQVARHAVPRDVHLIDALPRNQTGKVLHRQLRERAR